MYTMIPPGCDIAGTFLEICLMMAYHIVDQNRKKLDQVCLLINLSYPRGQCFRSSFKEMVSLNRVLLLRFSELNFRVVPLSSIYILFYLFVFTQLASWPAKSKSCNICLFYCLLIYYRNDPFICGNLDFVIKGCDYTARLGAIKVLNKQITNISKYISWFPLF